MTRYDLDAGIPTLAVALSRETHAVRRSLTAVPRARDDAGSPTDTASGGRG